MSYIFIFYIPFRDEQLNKEAYLLQIERGQQQIVGGQQPAKLRRRIDSKLHQYGLEFITCKRDLQFYISAYSHSVPSC